MNFEDAYKTIFEEALKELESNGSNYVGKVRSRCYFADFVVTEKSMPSWSNPRLDFFGSKPKERF